MTLNLLLLRQSAAAGVHVVDDEVEFQLSKLSQIQIQFLSHHLRWTCTRKTALAAKPRQAIKRLAAANDDDTHSRPRLPKPTITKADYQSTSNAHKHALLSL